MGQGNGTKKVTWSIMYMDKIDHVELTSQRGVPQIVYITDSENEQDLLSPLDQGLSRECHVQVNYMSVL